MKTNRTLRTPDLANKSVRKPLRRPSRFAQMRIGFDQNKSRVEFCGVLTCQYFSHSVRFENSYQLLHTMEQMMDEIDFPQSSMRLRKWNIKKKKEGVILPKRQVKHKTVASVQNPSSIEDVNPTFVVRVQFRQNATWQGSIHWVEAQKTANFRSMLEMIRLMDDAVMQTSPNPMDDDIWHIDLEDSSINPPQSNDEQNNSSE